MKTKVISLLLCLVMALSLVPAALAEGEDLSVYNGNEAVTAQQLEKNTGKTLTLAVKAEAAAYQWQIHIEGDLWANIYGETGKALTVHSGMVSGRGSSAEFRCLMDKTPSDTVTVTLVEGQPTKAPAPKAPEVLKEAQPVGEPQIVEPAVKAAPKAEEAPANDPAEGDENPVAPAEEGQTDESPAPSEAPSTFNIIINYVFENGTQAANPWTATVATGSTYTQDVQSPVVVGYTPSDPVVHVDTSEAKTYTVTYHPAEVEFTVKHYQQNVSKDEYTQVDTETKTGYTEAAVGDGLAKTDYTGFYSLLYDTTTTIAADGSTVVEVYYDRYYYLMNFDLDGGYGVEPIYARFGAPISVDTPTKPGYTFEGWDKTIPTTMPAAHTSYKAKWEIGTSGFTVVFWYENANDNGYSVAGTYKPADVNPGTEKKSDDYKNQDFTGRDTKHFTYNAAKAETVTVKGDGSTVLNVYYTRNTYTLTFKDGNIKIVCGKVEHKHSSTTCCDKTHRRSCNGYGIGGRCNTRKCPVGYEHEHTTGGWGTASCYEISDLIITAKYQADIHNNFPIKDGDKTIWWTVPNGCKSFKPGTQLGSIDTMPDENITFESNDSESGAKIYYYVETINGAAGDTTYKGRNYKQYKVIDLDYSSSTSLTYAEEFHPITGFTQGDSNPKIPVGGSVQMQETNYLYYTRNSYNLKFYNYNAYVDGKGGSVQYEAPLSSYDFTPAYPANLEKNAYVFAGWYTTAGCYEGSEADLSTMTMPASDVILYAKWTPKTHTVKAYQTKDALENGEDALHTYDNVPHGTTVTPTPADPKRDPYKFVGWFYISDTGEEKAFTFSMPVNRDLNLYAKWSSNTLVEYTIRYLLEDGTEIAPPTTGSALAGTTKTFNAKTGTELNKGYQSGYFPKVSSHSLTINIEGGNEFTFVYVAKNEVEYTVRYLDKTTGKPVVVDGVPTPDKVVKTRDAVVTETFKQITGYAPDAYQKQLVLAADGNEIIFWYVKDDAHAPVQIIHWIQNIEGEGYTEYQSSTNLNGVIGQTYTESSLTIPGFTYNANPAHPVDGYPAMASGALTEAGLVLNLYYDRIEYPYEFRFLEQGTDTKLADAVAGNARYQAQVTQTAKTIPGYTLVSAENQAINIAIEDPDDVASKNVRIFYYVEQTVEIKYAVVGPTDCGTLDNYQDAQLKVTSGAVKGSTPTAADGFKFVGWYKDEACTQSVDGSWVVDSKLTPKKTKDLGNSVMGYEAATYYAKFEWDVADLTIIKTGAKTEIDENQSFIFTVKIWAQDGPKEVVLKSFKVAIQGNKSVTIKGIPAGVHYTITEDSSWSWRYNAQEETGVLNPGSNSVIITNSRINSKWLGGDAYCQNRLNPYVN